jgi:hypothetical protein
MSNLGPATLVNLYFSAPEAMRGIRKQGVKERKCKGGIIVIIMP